MACHGCGLPLVLSTKPEGSPPLPTEKGSHAYLTASPWVPSHCRPGSDDWLKGTRGGSRWSTRQEILEKNPELGFLAAALLPQFQNHVMNSCCVYHKAPLRLTVLPPPSRQAQILSPVIMCHREAGEISGCGLPFPSQTPLVSHSPTPRMCKQGFKVDPRVGTG